MWIVPSILPPLWLNRIAARHIVQMWNRVDGKWVFLRSGGRIKRNFRTLCLAGSHGEANVGGRFDQARFVAFIEELEAIRLADSIVFLLLSCREKKFEKIYSGNKCKLLSFERNLSYASLVINSCLSPVFCCYSNGDREGKDAGWIEKRWKHSHFRAMVLREAGSSVENWTLVERDPWSGRVSSHRSRPAPFVPCGDSAATAAATAPTTHTLLAPTPHALSPIFWTSSNNLSPRWLEREKKIPARISGFMLDGAATRTASIIWKNFASIPRPGTRTLSDRLMLICRRFVK